MAGPGMHQSQNLSLQQVLAPQLQQSLLILQAPLLELRNLVQQEMETNPVLEELATEIGSDEGEDPKAEEADKAAVLRQAAEQGWSDLASGRFDEVDDESLDDFVGQLGLRAAKTQPAS